MNLNSSFDADRLRTITISSNDVVDGKIVGKFRFDQLDKLVNDAFKMAHFHNKKANYIDEVQLNISPDVTGIEFHIKGPAATPYQFYLTDNKKHFVRGVFYVKSKIDIDSLAPIHDFMIKDIQKIIPDFKKTIKNGSLYIKK